MTSTITNPRDVRAGADAFLALLGSIKSKTESDFEAFFSLGCGDEADVRDYAQLVQMLEKSLETNVTSASSAHRQGFLRSIVDLLALHVDGFAPDDDWDPLHSSAPAFFAAERTAQSHNVAG